MIISIFLSRSVSEKNAASVELYFGIRTINAVSPRRLVDFATIFPECPRG
jgi:hypothetical protein